MLLLSKDNEYNLSGRDTIYSDVLTQIKDNPIFGIGIAGDRLYSTSAHNIFLEILSGFGIILGSFIILVMFITILKGLFIKDKLVANQILVWLSLGLIPLMVSSSYLIQFQFWILLGLTLGQLSSRSSEVENIVKHENGSKISSV